MIHNEGDYRKAMAVNDEERMRIDDLAKVWKSQGLDDDEIKRLRDPMMSLHLQFVEEAEAWRKEQDIPGALIDPQPGVNKGIRLISLDIETTGLDPAKHVPLSIGAVDIASGRDYFVGLEWDELTIDTAAMRINRIDITRSDRDTKDKRPFGDSRPGRTLPAAQAIDEFGLWINEVRRWNDAEIWALGKNPASLDLPLLHPTWDRFWGRTEVFRRFPFSHRCVDLNSVFTTIAVTMGDDTTAVRNVITELAWDDLRKEAPQLLVHGDEMLPGRDRHYAMSGTWDALDEATGGSPKHHALADAWWNAYAWQRCILMLRLKGKA